MKMKNYKKSLSAVILLLIAGLGFYSCNQDKDVVPKTLEQYKSELSEIVASEKIVVSNCIVGYNKGDFKSEILYEEVTTEYLNALLSAESILAKADLSIADVMDANYLISKPGDVFNDNIWISDRRPLHEAIVICDTLRVHTPEGHEPGMAPKEARDRFGDAITAAKRVRSTSSTIDRQVLAATEELNLELDVFKDAIIK